MDTHTHTPTRRNDRGNKTNEEEEAISSAGLTGEGSNNLDRDGEETAASSKAARRRCLIQGCFTLRARKTFGDLTWHRGALGVACCVRNVFLSWGHVACASPGGLQLRLRLGGRAVGAVGTAGARGPEAGVAAGRGLAGRALLAEGRERQLEEGALSGALRRAAQPRLERLEGRPDGLGEPALLLRGKTLAVRFVDGARRAGQHGAQRGGQAAGGEVAE